VVLLVKALDPSSSSMNSFRVSPPSEDFLHKDINVPEEDVLYN
jgi:hypothetical protein